MEEAIQSKCGICVTHTLHDAYSFIKSLQHRGREACGIFALGKNKLDVIKWSGSVTKLDLIDLHKIFPASQYHTYGAHVRYATKGREDKILEDAHPHFIGGKLDNRGDHIIIRDCEAVAIHNGQVNFSKSLNPNSECDTKILLKYYLKNGEKNLIKNIPGSFILAIADKKKDKVIMLRDKFAVKPACLGLKDGKYCVASEDIALIENGALYVEDLDAGTIYDLSSKGGYAKTPIIANHEKKHCFFEWNYIANAHSMINGISVLKVRQELGKVLAEEFSPKDIDIVTFLPRCPESAARSYSKAIGKESKFKPVFYKLRGERSFQGTTQEDRKKSIKSNLHLLPGTENFLNNKTIAVIDDSTIRGTNSKHARELLEKAGAKKVYLLNYTPRIGAIGHDGIPRGCLFGVDMPPEDDFVVRTEDKKNNRTDEEISKTLGMQVYFLSPSGMFRAFERCGMKRENLCSFCIGGSYPFK
ncbi:Amidophosphoribosyltransferase [uncultured archaeon]|nr:Amidophosphoribosyltransferase [uncultured archaeon]